MKLKNLLLALGVKVFRLRPNYLWSTEDYKKHWLYADFNGKTVLDLGADYGSTAVFFLGMGVKKVIAVEGDKRLVGMMRSSFKNDHRVVPISAWIDSPKKITELVQTFKPNLVKCDIEGAEVHLLKVPLRLVKTWMVEAHSPELHTKLVQRFNEEGFSISLAYPIGVKIIIAKARGY
jgi:predicted RNA methylase